MLNLPGVPGGLVRVFRGVRRGRFVQFQNLPGICRSDLVQNLLGLGHLACRAPDRARRGRPAPGDAGQQLGAKVVAVEPCIAVGGIFEPFKPPGPAGGQNFRARYGEQRPGHEPGAEGPQPGDASQSFHARTPQQAQHQGFELIVGVVRRQQHLSRRNEIRQGAVPDLARLCLDALPRDGFHGASPALEVDAKARRNVPAMALPPLRIRMQSMIDVQRAHVRTRRQSANGREQDRRVEPPAEGNREFPRRTRQIGQAPAEAIQQSVHGTGGDASSVDQPSSAGWSSTSSAGLLPRAATLPCRFQRWPAGCAFSRSVHRSKESAGR